MNHIFKYVRPLVNKPKYNYLCGNLFTSRVYSSQSQQAKQPKTKYFRFRNNPYTPIMLMLVFYSSFTLELIRLKSKHKDSNQRFREQRSGIEDLIKRVKSGEVIDLEKELELIRIRHDSKVTDDYQKVLDELMKQDEAWAERAKIYEPNQESTSSVDSIHDDDNKSVASAKKETTINNNNDDDNTMEEIDFSAFFTEPLETEEPSSTDSDQSPEAVVVSSENTSFF